MLKSADCIIVGGGIQGMLTARILAKAGLDVHLIERGGLGLEASWAAGGILSPLHPWAAPPAITVLSQMSQGLYPTLAAELQDETGIDAEWLPSGLLTLMESDVGQAQAWAREWRYPMEFGSGMDLRPRMTGLGAVAGEWLWMPSVAQIRPPRLLKALAASLRRHGVRVSDGLSVQEVLVQGDRVEGVMVATGRLTGKVVVIAAGAWSASLCKLPDTSPITVPIAGEMILFPPGAADLQSIVSHGEHYLIPRSDGRILAGSTVEDRGFKRECTEEARLKLIRAAGELVPGLEHVSVEAQWTGLRPWAPVGIPYICSHPTLAGLYLNTGHFRNGIALAPASARLLADLVLDREPELNPSSYRVDAVRSDVMAEQVACPR